MVLETYKGAPASGLLILGTASTAKQTNSTVEQFQSLQVRLRESQIYGLLPAASRGTTTHIRLPAHDWNRDKRAMRIAMFHLDDRAGFLNGRTIVLNKTRESWKIVQLHASDESVTSTQQPAKKEK